MLSLMIPGTRVPVANIIKELADSAYLDNIADDMGLSTDAIRFSLMAVADGFHIPVVKATVIHSTGSDTIVFEVDLPSSMPALSNYSTVHMTVAADYSEEYLATNFPGLPYTVVQRA